MLYCYYGGNSNKKKGGNSFMCAIKKYLAEFLGTFVLVVFACGTAIVTGCGVEGGWLMTALAFGLVIVAMAYSPDAGTYHRHRPDRHLRQPCSQLRRCPARRRRSPFQCLDLHRCSSRRRHFGSHRLEAPFLQGRTVISPIAAASKSLQRFLL